MSASGGVWLEGGVCLVPRTDHNPRTEHTPGWSTLPSQDGPWNRPHPAGKNIRPETGSDIIHPLPSEQNDRRLWKHYLPLRSLMIWIDVIPATFYINTSLCHCVTASNGQVARPEWNPRQGITLPETASFDLLDWTGDTFSPVFLYLLTPCLAGFLLKTENRWQKCQLYPVGYLGK